ncbi:MAG: outer membrane lipid asymmetry maintenance protein MlaD [Paracoccaceae bacterium]|tara:strand:- start:165 stop:614 length:450 start_codon:yes stop_codon:yes gene_type:complete
MKENKLEVIIGAAVLTVALGFVVFLFQSTGLSVSNSGHYELKADFRSADGIHVGTDVRLAGVKVGTVSDLGLNAETYRAEAELAIKNKIDIPDDSALTVSSEGLLGGNFIEIIPGASYEYMQPGDEFLDTQGSVSLISLLLKFVSGSDN